MWDLGTEWVGTGYEGWLRDECSRDGVDWWQCVVIAQRHAGV